MDLGTLMAVAQTLLTALQCSQLKDALSFFGYKSQLNDLQHTVQAIDAVLCDAEAKQELSRQEQHLIEVLKDVVFEADDLFDEFVTLAEQKQLLKADGSLSKKVSNFFSRSNNPLSIAYRMSRGIKDIKKKLDIVAYNTQFSFKHDPEPIRKRRPETCSYVDSVDIIGREDDLEKIVGMFLDSNVQHDVSFLTIVGVGGLGKTALAQLVYNDQRVKSAFPLRKWTCVSDQDQKVLDVKEVICKILGLKNAMDFTMDEVQSQLREQLKCKKFLIVLDDVWTEKRDQWCELIKYLIKGEEGSWVVVTTRSQSTATIVGGSVHKLQGLSEENSWCLFERTAFASDHSNPPDELVKIGREIVDGCARVPLAIKVAGSLLYGQDKSKWQSIKEIGLACIKEIENNIMPILKLSFNHLESPLKCCFSYCAIFPKDYLIKKEMLIRLWMAQGYIVPFDKGQSVEDAGEEYFMILSRRCFFQDIKKDVSGEISCKIHDLMHDVAQSVSRKEIICALKTINGSLGKGTRHLSIASSWVLCDNRFFGKTHIRSLLPVCPIYEANNLLVKAVVANYRCVRALDLSNYHDNSLPASIGRLLHLRYLDLTNCINLEVLPRSIEKLYNLQTLKLGACESLKELPKHLSRLVKLRVLELWNCSSLTCMPRDMGKLTCLHTLSMLIVDGKESGYSWRQWVDGMEDLKALNNLKGKLEIIITWPKNSMKVLKEYSWRERLYLKSKKHLEHIVIHFKRVKDVGRMGEEETLRLMEFMEELQPHSNVKKLELWYYRGVKMPSWATLLRNLVGCWELEHLPCLGNLRHLKFLDLVGLDSLEYIQVEEENSFSYHMSSGLGRSTEEVSMFQSFETLWLGELRKLKGWRRGVVGMEDNTCLSQLKTLYINDCPELTWIPQCPSVEKINLRRFNQGLQIRLMNNWVRDEVTKLREMTIDNVAWLESLPLESFHYLQILKIEKDYEMLILPNWIQFLPALQILYIDHCTNLQSMPDWMPKLTSLRELKVNYCSERMKRRCQKDPPGEDWPYIQHIPNIQALYFDRRD